MANPPNLNPSDPQHAQPFVPVHIPPQCQPPLLVYSHGETQVDTIAASNDVVQRKLYIWSQVTDYSTMYCNQLLQRQNEPLCAHGTIDQCPGHPWVDYTYHCKVKQWIEDKQMYTLQRQQMSQQQPTQMEHVQMTPQAQTSNCC